MKRSAREVAARVAHRVDRDRAYLPLVLDAELDRAGLAAADRGLATELSYGVFRRRTRLERALAAHADRGTGRLDALTRAHLLVAAYQILFLDRVPARAAVHEAVGTLRRLRGPGLAGFANALLRRLADRGEPPLPAPGDAASLAEIHSLPPWITARFVSTFGLLEARALCEAFDAPSNPCVRANSLRTTTDALAARLGAELPGARIAGHPLAPDALEIAGGGSPFAGAAYAEGLFIGQDAGAQVICRMLAPASGERILDACAGLGGKTTYVAALAGPGAEVVAIDASPRKLELSQDHCRRLGTSGVTHVLGDLTAAGTIPGSFDRILLDAPCSGLGLLGRHPESRSTRTPEDVTSLSALQARMLAQVASALRPGGTLVYAVCTLTEEEGPAQVRALLGAAPLALAEQRWLLPHRDRTDGFYVARMIRARS